jgi:hypothetical protein
MNSQKEKATMLMHVVHVWDLVTTFITPSKIKTDYAIPGSHRMHITLGIWDVKT